MISHAMFEEFALPEIKAQAAHLDKALYHFDGIEQCAHLDSLLAIDDLDVIQWTCVDGQPSPLEFLPELKKIQQAGKRLLIHQNNIKIFEELLKELSSKGLYLYGMFETEDEARELVRLAERYSHAPISNRPQTTRAVFVFRRIFTKDIPHQSTHSAENLFAGISLYSPTFKKQPDKTTTAYGFNKRRCFFSSIKSIIIGTLLLSAGCLLLYPFTTSLPLRQYLTRRTAWAYSKEVMSIQTQQTS